MTQYLVFDASFTMKCLVPNAQQSLCIQMLEEWKYEGYTFCVPALWIYEVVSSLSKLVHFKQIHENKAQEALQLISAMELERALPETEVVNRAYIWTRQLNRAAAYDSFYLALAEARQCDLWTADSRLAQAVNQPWVKAVGV